MKRPWLAFAFAAFIGSSISTPAGDAASPALAGYRECLAKLPRARVEGIGKACAAYVEHMAGEPVAARDAAFLDFRRFYGEFIREANKELGRKQLDEGYVWGEEAHRAEEEQYEALVKKNGLVLLEETEIYYVAEAPDYLARNFGQYVSPAIQDYLKIRQSELGELFQYDGTLKIPFTSVAARCVAWEEYLSAHPKSPLRAEAESFYRTYLGALMVGTQNTRVIEVDGAIPSIRNEVGEAYDGVIARQGKTRTAALLREYLPLLRESGFTESDAVAEFLDEHGVEMVDRGF